MRSKRLGAALALVVLAGSGMRVAEAQISPGALSSAHADLEGSANCLKCHERRQGVAPDQCLECHRLLSERIEAGKGLHAGEEYGSCEKCHVEHHGRDFELVWWGEAGEGSFDHRAAGYPLEGAHARLECRDCHKSSLVDSPALLVSQGKDLTRTYLGLKRESCLSCHEDVHRAQFPSESCQTCHSLERWNPAAGFNHDRSRFALTGRHVQVACIKCHLPGEPAQAQVDVDQLKFTGLAFQGCADCHRDSHEGRLGADCRSCHSTDSWRHVDRRRLDHDRTRFALAGRHIGVACEKCHRPGASMRVSRFGECADCHRDPHLGQLAATVGGAGCDSCHTVEGFIPVLYPIERHQVSAFPLEGAHLAVPCNACHKRVGVAALAGQWPVLSLRRGVPASIDVTQFRFASQACVSCHADPHLEAGSETPEDQLACTGCHDVDTWRSVTYDHRTTRFPLVGRHLGVVCRDCHSPAEDDGRKTPVRFKTSSLGCADCHRDPHAGQFRETGSPSTCDRCHTAGGWRETLFVHNRDSKYRLDGAHSRVPCRGCHRDREVDGVRFVQYKPIPSSCESCHVSGVAELDSRGG